MENHSFMNRGLFHKASFANKTSLCQLLVSCCGEVCCSKFAVLCWQGEQKKMSALRRGWSHLLHTALSCCTQINTQLKLDYLHPVQLDTTCSQFSLFGTIGKIGPFYTDWPTPSDG